MAEPLSYEPTRRDPREELYLKLSAAPREHAEALLDGYEILQLMRDKGLLELGKGLLGSGEKVLGILTQTLETGEAISLVRNLTVLVKILGGLNPEVLEDLQRALTTATDRAENKKPAGLFRLAARLTGRDSRRFLDVATAAISAVGKHLDRAKEPGLRGELRQKVTRRRVTCVSDDGRTAP